MRTLNADCNASIGNMSLSPIFSGSSKEYERKKRNQVHCNSKKYKKYVFQSKA